jgi:hypothetical protein
MKVFRCAHIAAQLNRGVPSKVVVDVVGHSDTRSLSRYAGIDIEQLRRCALPVPNDNGYRSRLANELQAFLEFERSLGFQYDSAE